MWRISQYQYLKKKEKKNKGYLTNNLSKYFKEKTSKEKERLFGELLCHPYLEE